MPDNKENMLVYSQQDMQMVMRFLNSLTVNGVAAARQLSAAATILEAGKPLDEYIKKEGEDDGL